MSRLYVYEADETDLPTVAAMARRIWPVVYRDILLPEHIESILARVYDVPNLKQEMKDGHRFWIARSGVEMAGYASAFLSGGEVWLKKLYVDPQAQNQGVGRLLLAEIMVRFPYSDSVKLYVNRANLPAQRFYERQGFTCIGEAPVRMGDYDFVDLIYAKKLPAMKKQAL